MTSGSGLLVVVLHGFSYKPGELRSMVSVINRAYPEARIEVPKLALQLFSFGDPLAEVDRVLGLIDSHWHSGTIRQVILVGHSAGALLARKVYVASCGNAQAAPLDAAWLERWQMPRQWAAHVDRVILLAGLNCGWSIDYHMPLKRVMQLSFAVAVGELIRAVLGRTQIMLRLRRGSPFVAQLRLQWMAMRRRSAAGGPGAAPVVQLLGTIDDLVSPRDNVDSLTSDDFIFLDVPKSGHSSVIRMDVSPESIDRAPIARARIFEQALTQDAAALQAAGVPGTDLRAIVPDPAATDVVFVIHGIRDEGYWTDKIARAIVLEARKSERTMARVTSTYGYFGMLPFLLPWERHRKVEWLMDTYAEAVARFPNAERFHYVGHSNGTYLLARALEDYECCCFDRVVFAGSVVRTSYDWKRFQQEPRARIGEVLNYVATADWVVAFFPNGFERLRLQDIGGAGHRGFTQLATAPSNAGPGNNVEYVIGQHSAAIREENWEAIARFVIHGRQPGQPLCLVKTSRAQAFLVWLLGLMPPVVWLGILLILIGVPISLVRWLHWPEWAVTSAVIVYGLLVLFTLNRV